MESGAGGDESTPAPAAAGEATEEAALGKRKARRKARKTQVKRVVRRVASERSNGSAPAQAADKAPAAKAAAPTTGKADKKEPRVSPSKAKAAPSAGESSAGKQGEAAGDKATSLGKLGPPDPSVRWNGDKRPAAEPKPAKAKAAKPKPPSRSEPRLTLPGKAASAKLPSKAPSARSCEPEPPAAKAKGQTRSKAALKAGKPVPEKAPETAVTVAAVAEAARREEQAAPPKPESRAEAATKPRREEAAASGPAAVKPAEREPVAPPARPAPALTWLRLCAFVAVAAAAGYIVWGLTAPEEGAVPLETAATVEPSRPPPAEPVETATAEPRQEAALPALTLAEAEELEDLLERLAFEPGPVDGEIDEQARSAIRNFQGVANLPADGEPSQALLVELREVAKMMAGQ